MGDANQVGFVTVEELRAELRKFATEAIWHGDLRRGVHEDMQKMLLDLQTTLLEQLAPARRPKSAHGLLEGRGSTSSALNGNATGLSGYASNSSTLTSAVNGVLRDAAVQEDDDGVALATTVNVRPSGSSLPPGSQLPGAVEVKLKANGNEDDDLKRQVSPADSTVSKGSRVGSDRAPSLQINGETPKSVRSPKITFSLEEGKRSDHLIRNPRAAKEKEEPNSPQENRPRLARTASRVISTAKARDGPNPGVRSSISGISTASRMTTFQSMLLQRLNHPYFEYITAAFILINGVLIGVQSDYVARNDLDEAPGSFEVLEFVFCIVFTVELGLRLFAYRRRFFTMIGWTWNIFDFSIVLLQLVELCLKIVSSSFDFNFNILRILRLIRIVRLARVLRLIGELKTIVSSIGGSLKPLFWTAVLLFMIVYVLGICLTQAVHTKKMSLMKENKEIPEALDIYWSSLILSIFALFESITGGVDWDTVCRPLIDHIGPEVGLLFCVYILFTVLAMLNVVTGVFIDSVMTNATHEKELKQVSHVEALFNKLDIDHSGEITWEQFQKQLQQKEMRDFFRTIDVDIDKARSLFELLDLDDSGSVDVGEFMDGCLRIWSPAKGLDLRMILRDVNRVACMLRDLKRKGNLRSEAGSDDGADSDDLPPMTPTLSTGRPSLEP